MTVSFSLIDPNRALGLIKTRPRDGVAIVVAVK